MNKHDTDDFEKFANNAWLSLVNATEKAAICAYEHIGKGDKIKADESAVVCFREVLSKIDFSAEVAVGEGVKDDAPMLYVGERLGTWKNEKPIFEIAIDPLDGTTQTARGGNEAMTVLALGNKGCFLRTDQWYMHKLAYGQAVKKTGISIMTPIKNRVNAIAAASYKDVGNVTVCVLDRPRHINLIKELRDAGCRIKLIQDCDITASIATALPDSGIDAYMGIGGSPEGIIGAAAMKCLGGGFQAILCDKDGNSQGNPLGIEDLASGNVSFCATGVTNGSLLAGVTRTSRGYDTYSLVLRSDTGSIQWINTSHTIEK
jgi:fructose-1,6-bisphosphatase class II